MMPKLGLTISQYLWCWAIVVLILLIPDPGILHISGYFIYLYIGSASLSAIYLLLRYAGKSKLILILSFLELLAILLQFAACYANLSKKVNWFHSNFKDILTSLHELEILLLTIAGIYGFILLAGSYCWHVYRNRDRSSHKSHLYPLLYERRHRRR